MSRQPTKIRRFDVENRTVTKVVRGNTCDEVTFDDGFSMGLPSDAPVRPRIGTAIEMTMDGNRRVGYSIGGVVCENPHPLAVHLRNTISDLETDLKNAKKAQADLSAKNEKVRALPQLLRERILRFRAANLDFVWKYEDYEMACCMEAARLLERFQAEDDIVAFTRLSYNQQKMVHPNMDDGHSGNTFGFAIMLARAIKTGQDLRKLPPAITPITGQEPHGNWQAVLPPQMDSVA